MRRAIAVFALACLAAAGFVAASVLAGTQPLAAVTDSTGSTATTATTQTTSTTTPSTRAKPKPKPTTRLARGVTIGGIHVGGLTPAAALAALRLAARSPLVVTVDGERVPVSPDKLGVKSYLEGAVARARQAKSGADVPLVVTVHGADVHAWVARLADKRDRAVRDAHVVLDGMRPRVVAERSGFSIRRQPTVAAIVEALRANRRGPIAAVAELERPSVRSAYFTSAVVIRRESKRLQYYKGEELELARTFTVATGQSSYPTPLGSFEIVQMWRNPWWYPPPSPWAEGLKPVPPGPGNPLGTRWMGLNVAAVGIHGTPDAASLGYSASHGCIRMAIPSAEWLFSHVKIGTPVFIVSA